MQEKWLSCKLDEVEMSKCKTWAGLTMAFAAWCCLQLLLAAASVHGQRCSITLHNNCSQGVRACVQAAWSGNPDEINEYDLVVGASRLLHFNSCTNGQGTISIWRTRYSGCTENGSPGSPAGKDLCNLAEIKMGPGSADSYSLSNVNAFNSGLRIVPVGALDCTPISCAVSDLNFICDGDNQLVVSNEGYFVSCINTDGSRGLGPTDSTQLFKQACPSAYSYNHDDATSTFTCAHGTPYSVTFCPTDQSYW